VRTKNRYLLPIIILIILALSIFSACGVIDRSSKAEIHTAQTRIEKRLCDESFVRLSKEKKHEAVEKLTDELYEDGLISQRAVYSEDAQLFSFSYTDGTYGGISLQTFDERLNRGPASGRSFFMDRMVSSRTNNALETIFLNAFEDSSFRRDYYVEVQQEWQAKGINTTIDTLVTLDDLARLERYDVFVFSMHGSVYKGSPVLCLNEIATSSTDKKYEKYLNGRSVAKVFTTEDYNYHYWVFPDYFTQCYEPDALDGKVCWSESCEFFGDDAYTQNPDTSFSDALLQLSCEAVLGYRNSVEANYSRNVMKYSLDAMFSGTEVQFALDSAKITQGYTDGWEDLSKRKREAYPLHYGNSMYVVAKNEEQGVPTQSEAEELFNETYWHMSFGQSLGYKYDAKFSSDGSFVARGMGSGRYENGTYTYSNGKLVIVFDIDGFGYPSTIEFSGNKDGFISLDQYPMQVGEDYYYLWPENGVSEFFEEGLTSETTLADGEYYGLLETWNSESMTIELLEYAGRHAQSFNYLLNPTGQIHTLDISKAEVCLEYAWGDDGNDIWCASIDDALNTEIWGAPFRENCPMQIFFSLQNGRVKKIMFLYAA